MGHLSHTHISCTIKKSKRGVFYSLLLLSFFTPAAVSKSFIEGSDLKVFWDIKDDNTTDCTRLPQENSFVMCDHEHNIADERTKEIKLEKQRLFKSSSGLTNGFHWDILCGKTRIKSTAHKLNLGVSCFLPSKHQEKNDTRTLCEEMTTSVHYPIFNASVALYNSNMQGMTELLVELQTYKQYIGRFITLEHENIQIHLQHFSMDCFFNHLYCSYIQKMNHGVPHISSLNISSLTATVKIIQDLSVKENANKTSVAIIAPTAIKVGNPIVAAISLYSASEFQYSWIINAPFNNYSFSGSSLNVTATDPGIYHLAVSLTSTHHNNTSVLSLCKQVKVVSAIENITAILISGKDYAALVENPDRSYSTPTMHLRVFTDVEANFNLDFGDGTPSVFLSGMLQSNGFGASALHTYNRVGDYIVTVTAFNELFNATKLLGPYFVQEHPTNLSIVMNTSTVYKDDSVKFSAILRSGTSVSYTWSIGGEMLYAGQDPVINYRFSTASDYKITVTASNKVGKQEAWIVVNVFPKNTSGTEEHGPSEFIWNFGHRIIKRIYSRSIQTKFQDPKIFKYNTSDIRTKLVQSKVIPNRLVSSPSVLVNSSVSFYCRINRGSHVSYFWNFGDGTKRLGKMYDKHVYEREGEYTVSVSIFNNVSSASLTKQIFVVKEHCQPPPVKNMGPLKLQIRRYETLHLGVTFEASIICNNFQGLQYLWSFMKPDGTYISLPAHIVTNKQTITLPAFFLDYGEYKAVARVQIVGTVVYSNYTVNFEVYPTAPVSMISDGHHHFIDTNSVKTFILNGTASFDPDIPGALLRFYWDCTTLTKDYCFNSDEDPLQTNEPVVTFLTALLNDHYDQFQFTLSVSSGDRRSKNAETFLSLRPNSNLRLLQMVCVGCQGTTVNWNKPFTVQAVCMDCIETVNITYKWKLFWINATEGSNTDVPFCRIKESMGVPSSLGAIHSQNETYFQISDLLMSTIDPIPTSLEHDFIKDYSGVIPTSYKPEATTEVWSNESTKNGIGEVESDFIEPAEALGFAYGNGQGGIRPQNTNENQTHQEYDTHFVDIKEGIGGSGTRTDGETAYEDTFYHQHTSDDLVDMPYKAPPTLHMINWSKLPISNALFSTYLISDLTSKSVSLKPFVLKPSKMYMLEIILESNEKRIGQSQLYLGVSEMSPKITCQVQPRDGTEVFTIFSIFCTSGNEDLYYDFSYQVGNLSRNSLYKGRDIQYYFNLPSGDPSDGYQVTIFTQITNAYGSQTQPCPVNVTVQPIAFRNVSNNGLEETKLFQDGLRNLSTLVLMGNHIEIRNYVVLLTTILNRMYADDRKSFEFQFQIRNKLIFIVQNLGFNDQDELTDIVAMLKDLSYIKNQLTPESAELILKFTKSLVKDRSGRFQLHSYLAEDLISLASSAIEVSSKWSEMKNTFLSGMDIISELLLNYIDLNNRQQFNFSTSSLDLQTSINENCQNPIQAIGPVTVNLTNLLYTPCRVQSISASTCYISQLLHFREKVHFLATLPFETDNSFTSFNLFDCFSKRKLNPRYITSPVTIETDQRNQSNRTNKTMFSLFRDKINFHQFNTTPDNKHSALRIIVTFYESQSRGFPVLLLIRYSKKPSPVNFNLKQFHSMDKNSTQIFIPATAIKDFGFISLALMDADYKRHPKNNYISKVLQYNIDIQWTQCLSWQNEQWNMEDCSPQKGDTGEKLVCSCRRLGLYTTASIDVESIFDMEDVSHLLSTTNNPTPCIIVGVCLVIYILLIIFGKQRDEHEDKKNALVFLQDNSLTDQQQYAIMVKVGFRSRPQSTAKVYIVLHGEDGVSETRELFSPDRPLFERNSRHIFIMSVPDSLGPLWKIYIWHNNSGPSPSLYLSHVIIKDLKSRISYFFYAECWLAIDEGDGKVECELTSVGHGLGFKKLFYSKFTEYLEDFHFWGSVFSRPSYSWFTYTQRITTCFVLCLGYMCINIIIIYWTDDQYTNEHGPVHISTTSLICGIEATLVVYPLALLLSLLFRHSKKLNKYAGEDCSKTSHISCHAGNQHSVPEADTITESNLTWQHFQYWAYDTWMKKSQTGFSTSSIYSADDSVKDKFSCHLPAQITNGFEDCSCYNGHGQASGMKNVKKYTHGMCLQYSSGLCLFDSFVLQKYSVLPPWCVYVAWSLCAALSLVFGIITIFIGVRLCPTKCVLWLHAVFFSVVYCIFIVQPFLILLISLLVAWRKTERTDFFMDALSEDIKHLTEKQYSQPSHLTPPSSIYETSDFEKILAARKRARFLRLARPPTRAQLRIAREKTKKKQQLRTFLGEFPAYAIMTGVFMFIIMAKYSNNQYLLTQSIRNEFMRNPVQPFGEITTEIQWWNWSFNVLFNRLYGHKLHNELNTDAESAPIQGNFFLIGIPIIIKFEDSDSVDYMVRNVNIPYLTAGNPFFKSSDVNTKEKKYKQHIVKTKEMRDQMHYHCGKIRCYSGQQSVIILGRLRTEAYSALQNIQSQGWIDRGTRAVAIQFVLYNAPTNLFTMVSLLAEFPLSGGMVTSSVIESLKIYSINTLVDYLIMLLKMVLLAMTLVSVYIQVSSVIQKSVRVYIQDPWNFVEVAISVLSLCYFISNMYYYVLIVDIVDQLQKGFFKEFVHFGFIADFQKWHRFLHGIILFFMTIKLIKMLHCYKMMAPCIDAVHLFYSSSAFTMLVFLLCFSFLRHVILSSDYSFANVLQSIQTTLMQMIRVYRSKQMNYFSSQNKCNWGVATFGMFFAVFILLWTGMLKGSLTPVTKFSKKVQHSRHLVTFKEVISHAKEVVISIVYGHKQKRSNSVSIAGNNFYFDEFEDLIDELLFRLNTISDSLHHSLPAKSLCYTEEDEEINHFKSYSNFSFKPATTENEDIMQNELREQLEMDVL